MEGLYRASVGEETIGNLTDLMPIESCSIAASKEQK
jgi:hypothetical protein